MKKGLFFGIIFSLILISVVPTFTQGEDLEEPEKQVTSAAQIEPEMLWLWGEVVSVDPQKNEILIKTPDYETDQEKEVTIIVDENTTYENAASLSEIKTNDTLTIDYIVNLDSKNLAKNISLEKPGTEPVPLLESVPETTSETAPETYPEEAPSEIPPEG